MEHGLCALHDYVCCIALPYKLLVYQLYRRSQAEMAVFTSFFLRSSRNDVLRKNRKCVVPSMKLNGMMEVVTDTNYISRES